MPDPKETSKSTPRYLIPSDWESRPELLPALKILVEGARRAVLRKKQVASSRAG